MTKPLDKSKFAMTNKQGQKPAKQVRRDLSHKHKPKRGISHFFKR